MDSARAHGFLIAGLINDHLRERWPQDMDWGGRMPEGSTSYAPCCCGPCAALKDYFFTPRGRAEADAYAMALPKSPSPGHGYDWQNENGSINWHVIEIEMARGWCPNHEED